jgi:hypothetical protein
MPQPTESSVIIRARVGRRKDPTRREVENILRSLTWKVEQQFESHRRLEVQLVLDDLVAGVIERVTRPVTNDVVRFFTSTLTLAVIADHGLDFVYLDPLPPPPPKQGFLATLIPSFKSSGVARKGGDEVLDYVPVPLPDGEWQSFSPSPPPLAQRNMRSDSRVSRKVSGRTLTLDSASGKTHSSTRSDKAQSRQLAPPTNRTSLLSPFARVLGNKSRGSNDGPKRPRHRPGTVHRTPLKVWKEPDRIMDL